MKVTDPISFYSDFLNLDDLCDRVEDLEDQKEYGELEDDDAHELEVLVALLEELCGNGGDHQWRGDWYPSTLIHQSAFTDYCKELVSDIGDLPSNLPAYLVIDWDATATNLEVDYTSVEVDGNIYLYR